jgi:hypothetical protein
MVIVPIIAEFLVESSMCDIGSDIRARSPVSLSAGAGSKALSGAAMRTPGVEPGPLAGQDPKSCASASSATFACLAR